MACKAFKAGLQAFRIIELFIDIFFIFNLSFLRLFWAIKKACTFYLQALECRCYHCIYSVSLLLQGAEFYFKR